MKAEGRRASLNPIAGTTAPGPGRRRAPARLREGPRRARDARRPRPQRPLARLPRGHGPRRALPRGRSASRTSPTSSRRSSASCATGCAPFDLLRACFPAGTVSGAPKVRAMQIISELEGYRRGPYAGAVGYALPGGDLDTCIAIRTIVLARRRRPPPGRRGDRRRLRPARRARGVPAQARRARDGDRSARATMILLVDNYDSFTYNLVHLFEELGAEVVVRRNDADRRGRGRAARARRTSSSRPAPAGRTTRARRSRSSARLAPTTPTLGVCLGHQAIVEAFGGEIGQAQELLHGKASVVAHDGHGIFAGLPQGFQAGRYHSLAATRVPDALEVSATSRRRRGDGRAPPRAARRRRPVPPRVGAHARSARDLCRNFLEGR